MTTTTEAPTRFRWDRLTYSSALGYCMLVAGLSVGVVLGELRSEFGISGVVAALHGSTFGIGLLVAGVWGVRLVDRIGRRSALQLSVMSIAVGVILFCLGPAWPITLFGTALSGGGGALLVMVMPGVISDHHREHRATAFAAVNGAPGIAGLLFSLVIGGALGAGLSWRPPYLLLTMAFLAALAVVAWPVAVPEGHRDGEFSLAPFREREVLVPWLHIVNAVLTEFTVGIWAVTYLHEVGKASSGLAAVVASVFGIMMFTARLVLPTLLRWFGTATVALSFLTIGTGALIMAFAPGLPLKVLGLTIVGFGGGPLYPLTVDAFYARAGHRLDSVSMGAFCALASGVAVTLGPLALGVLADSVGLRWALLVVPCLALLGAITQRPRPVEVAPA
ncbi:MAG: MFS transporter [Actinobacteria bacterium]|nr:MFS transporter [Actinomycetota bacterium]